MTPSELFVAVCGSLRTGDGHPVCGSLRTEWASSGWHLLHLGACLCHVCAASRQRGLHPLWLQLLAVSSCMPPGPWCLLWGVGPWWECLHHALGRSSTVSKAILASRA